MSGGLAGVATCAAVGCDTLIRGERVFCIEDWRSLPASMRDELVLAERLATCREAYDAAVADAVAYLARAGMRMVVA